MFNRRLFATAKNVLGNLFRLLGIAWRTDRFLTLGYYGSAGISAIFPIITSYIFKLFLDSVIQAQNITPTIPLVVIAILSARYVASLLWDFFAWVLKETYFDYLLRYKLQNYLNTVFTEKLSKMDVSDLENPKIQDLITKVKDTLTWRPPDFLRAFSYLFNNMVSFVSAFVLLFTYGFWIPVAIAIFGIPRLILRAKMGSLQWSIWGSGAPEVRKLWYLQWLLTHKETIVESKVFQSGSALISRYKEIQNRLFEKNKEPVKKFARIAPLPQIIGTALLFAFAYIRLDDVLTGGMSIGDFTFYVELLSRLADSVGGMVGNFGWMYENNLYVNHFFDVMAIDQKIKDKKGAVNVPTSPYPPSVEFRNVRFKYPGSKKYALNDVSFKIASANNVALVGKNGAGKTTLVKLLCRFYDVTSGEIIINGVNIKDIKLDDWYRYLGTLFQDFAHYDFTIRENILLGNPEKNDNKLLIEAAKKSGALEFIEKLPKKFDQQLGKEYEGGLDLSQGQWQKLAIARAFYEGAPMLILDEPTSSIDAESEYEIFNNLHTVYKDKSLLFISHRFSTVRKADKIIVIDKGKVVEDGSHDDLIARKGMYARLFNLQARAYQ